MNFKSTTRVEFQAEVESTDQGICDFIIHIPSKVVKDTYEPAGRLKWGDWVKVTLEFCESEGAEPL